jgi:hypothetical protein
MIKALATLALFILAALILWGRLVVLTSKALISVFPVVRDNLFLRLATLNFMTLLFVIAVAVFIRSVPALNDRFTKAWNTIKAMDNRRMG